MDPPTRSMETEGEAHITGGLPRTVLARSEPNRDWRSRSRSLILAFVCRGLRQAERLTSFRLVPSPTGPGVLQRRTMERSGRGLRGSGPATGGKFVGCRHASPPRLVLE